MSIMAPLGLQTLPRNTKFTFVALVVGLAMLMYLLLIAICVFKCKRNHKTEENKTRAKPNSKSNREKID